MNTDTANWDWPQWAFLVWMLLHFILSASLHGKPMVVRTGPDKGEPMTHNGFMALSRVVLLMFFVIAGGFYS